MISSWNGVFATKSCWGVNELWGLRHLGDLLAFIKKSLFVDNSRAFLYFTYIFWEMIPYMTNLNSIEKKSTDVASRRFEVTFTLHPCISSFQYEIIFWDVQLYMCKTPSEDNATSYFQTWNLLNHSTCFSVFGNTMKHKIDLVITSSTFWLLK